MSFGVDFAKTFLSIVVDPVFEQCDEFHWFSTVDDPAYFGHLRIAFLLQKALNTKQTSWLTTVFISISPNEDRDWLSDDCRHYFSSNLHAMNVPNSRRKKIVAL